MSDQTTFRNSISIAERKGHFHRRHFRNVPWIIYLRVPFTECTFFFLNDYPSCLHPCTILLFSIASMLLSGTTLASFTLFSVHCLFLLENSTSLNGTVCSKNSLFNFYFRNISIFSLLLSFLINFFVAHGISSIKVLILNNYLENISIFVYLFRLFFILLLS